MLTVGPVGKDEARLLTYLALRDGNWDVLLRTAQPVPELVQQADERRELMMGHGLALLALAAAALLALLPGRASGAPGPGGALDAYAEAMNRLRRRWAARRAASTWPSGASWRSASASRSPWRARGS